VLELQQRVLHVLQESGTSLSLTQIAEKAGATNQVEAIYKILRHLQANQRDVTSQGNLGQPNSLIFSATR
jgi:glucose-6-phosphate isomerase